MMDMSAVAALRTAADRLGAVWAAAQPGDPDPSSGHGPEWGKAAPAGLLIWLFMGTALFFLVKSMNRHMKRVPKSFDTDAAAPEAATQAMPSADTDGPPSAAGGDVEAGDADPLGVAPPSDVGEAAAAQER